MMGPDPLWEQIVSFEPLCTAARRAARGKRRVLAVARWMADLEPNTLRLERELRSGSWRPGQPTTFHIHDPKTRIITVAPFEDRVVHHALMDRLEPILDAVMIDESFACRRGKGTHAAVEYARRLVCEHGWFLKLDVARCFDSIHHDLALDCLGRFVSSAPALELAERIVRAGGRGGRGLPIGNLTSQWLANLLLDRLDQHVADVVRPAGYLRYMDDFALFGESRHSLRRAHEEIRRFLSEELRLELKERVTVLAPIRQGLPWLGWRIHRGTVRLRPENLRRLRRRLRHRLWEARTGRIGEECLQASIRSVMDHLRHGSTLHLRRRWIEELGGLSRQRESLHFPEVLSEAGPRRRQPRQPGGQLQQHPRQHALGQPQQQQAVERQPQSRPTSRQGVEPPDRDGHRAGSVAPRPPMPRPASRAADSAAEENRLPELATLASLRRPLHVLAVRIRGSLADCTGATPSLGAGNRGRVSRVERGGLGCRPL